MSEERNLNVPEAEERARMCVWSEMDSQSDHDLLALAALARELALWHHRTHAEHFNSPGGFQCGGCALRDKSRAAGLLPARESAAPGVVE